MRIVIALCGAAGAGKDEAARALAPLGFEKRSFAEPLRREVYEALCHPKQGRETIKHAPDSVTQAYRACYQHVDFDPWRKPTSHDMRVLLQEWGVWRRSQHEDYFVDRALAGLPNEGRFVFTDLRFPNERYLMYRLNAVVIRIRCTWAEARRMTHESETHWPHFEVHAEIANNGTKEELHAAMLARLSEIPCLAAALSSSLSSEPTNQMPVTHSATS